MTNKELQDKLEQEHKEKLDKRMKQITNYLEKHPEPVKIILSEGSRNYLKAVSSNSKTGKEWDSLEQKIKDTHTKMLSDAIKKLHVIEPDAFIKPRKIAQRV